MLNIQKGNMYGFVTHTWNPIKGRCSHDCKYCYMKRFTQKPLRLVEKELNDDLGSGNFIFVGSSTDMFANDVPEEWIMKVLNYCDKFDNKYLFQSKNPERMNKFVLPPNTIVATTIETNRDYQNDKVPYVSERADHIKSSPYEKMVTIEPIMDFDLDTLISWLKDIKPRWINIGADSKGHNLPEPTAEKIIALIYELKKFTEVKVKDNLKRLVRKAKKEGDGN